MKSLLLVVAIVLIATPMSVLAEPPNREVYIGFGSKTCGYWLTAEAEKDQHSRNLMLTWTQGYVYGSAIALLKILPDELRRNVSFVEMRGMLPIEPTNDDLRRFFHTASGSWFDVPQAEALEHWLTKYCFDHPLVVIADAADALTMELMPGQTRQK